VYSHKEVGSVWESAALHTSHMTKVRQSPNLYNINNIFLHV